jgi:hypothetical protein
MENMQQLMIDMLNKYYPEATPVSNKKSLNDCFIKYPFYTKGTNECFYEWWLSWNDVFDSTFSISENRLRKNVKKEIKFLKNKYINDFKKKYSNVNIFTF